ncbi:MAG: ABC transporter permease [Planctomycetota bacterium]|nr:ABC transporter permease [Planctomycetota bacterium]
MGRKSILARLFAMKEAGILFGMLGICVVLSMTTSSFLNRYNLTIVVRQASFVGIVALGQTMVLLTGGIDLSVGFIAGLVGILTTLLMSSFSVAPLLAVPIGLAAGAVFGVVNGLVISRVKVNPFITTLALGEIFAGAIMVITNGYPILNLPSSFSFLGQGQVFGMPMPVIVFLVVGAMLAYILRYTAFGRNIYAIGGNRLAARLVGIRVERVISAVYMLAGFLAALAGILFSSRISTGQPTTGANWGMPCITAAIIGGTSLSGGEGSIVGTILGSLFMAVLANGIVLLDISPYWERIIIGAVVILAVVIDVLRTRGRPRS